ncbi:helix-turn-helix protein [Paenibacillus sp. BK033]|uniref:helix-turn-helix domain-containing protein n=1 Tax=Paenibacillus sp. BK033 TaxID=2512133 RepID=UPI001049B696|nr:helix-turn-helix transcriptional regulator [Paenibacillus sp. BK033]TCM89655.1 helix-turn-helix protein [Paenibacillus sp. BK033]
MDEVTSFGESVKAKRTELGYSLRELAEKAEVSPSQLSKIERGLATPTEETVNKLAYALNVQKETMMFLAGYVDRDLREELIVTNRNKMKNASVIASAGLATAALLPILGPAVSATIGAAIGSVITGALKSSGGSTVQENQSEYKVTPENTMLTEEEQVFLDRELKSAYDLTMKRIMMMRKAGGEQDYVQRSGRVSRGTGDVPVGQRSVDDDTSDRS